VEVHRVRDSDFTSIGMFTTITKKGQACSLTRVNSVVGRTGIEPVTNGLKDLFCGKTLKKADYG